MKKATLIATALVCAHFLVAGIASAQPTGPRYSAGLSPVLAVPHPKTEATLTADANRLIRWQGWLDVDAFSISVLAQMQKQLGTNIDLGKFTIGEESILEAVMESRRLNPTFVMNESLEEEGEKLIDAKLYVWTYRHNYTDTGLYQLYVSVKGKMLIGTQIDEIRQPGQIIPHRDIQALGYEFGNNNWATGGTRLQEKDVYVNIEIWRGAVVRVNARGEIEVVGNEAGVVMQDRSGVEKAPLADWERAPSLIGNWNYNPKDATGASYWNPLDHPARINENLHQKRPGDVQAEGRVRTVPVRPAATQPRSKFRR